MKKIISFLYLVFIVKLAAFGQQDPQFTNNMFYKLGVNPGYAGAEGKINGLILNRYQWEGFLGAPKTLIFSADAAIEAFGAPGGFGLNVISDQLGFAKFAFVNVNYAYQKELSIGKLGFGLSLGLVNAEINPKEWLSSDDILNETSGGTGDPWIPETQVSRMALDAGFGLYLSSNKYYLGLSTTHLNQASIKYEDVENYYLVRHYYLTGGYNIKLSDPLFELRPSFLFKSDIASWQLDLNMNVVFDDRFWGGISYRVQDAIALLMGMEMENGLRFGYSFDLTTSALARYGYGSHEIFVSYSLDLEKNRNQKYKSIRFL
ncbi:MAG: type IX secretion system membrane protein PorP/SprF [Draconibacterium sp.]